MYQLYFRDWWEADTRDTILRDRNHPSIMLWSVANEIRDNLNSQTGRNRFLAQHDLVHSLDPTRPVTMGLFRHQESRHIPRFTDLLDVVDIHCRPGRLVALSTGERTNHQSFAADKRSAFNGECPAIVRVTADSGEVTLTVSSPDLEAAST